MICAFADVGAMVLVIQGFDGVFGVQGYNRNLITRSFMNFGFCSGSFKALVGC